MMLYGHSTFLLEGGVLFEGEQIKASYTHGQQSQDRTK
jgi:hypothetical protein